jgi:cytoskeletal protein RodZ
MSKKRKDAGFSLKILLLALFAIALCFVIGWFAGKAYAARTNSAVAAAQSAASASASAAAEDASSAASGAASAAASAAA